MKTRTGFVSNSSSTSFGLAHPDKDGSLKVTFDLSKYVRNTCRTEQELREYLEDYFGENSLDKDSEDFDDYAYARYEKFLPWIRQGKAISILNVDRDSFGLFDDLLDRAGQNNPSDAPVICWTSED